MSNEAGWTLKEITTVNNSMQLGCQLAQPPRSFVTPFSFVLLITMVRGYPAPVLIYPGAGCKKEQ